MDWVMCNFQVLPHPSNSTIDLYICSKVSRLDKRACTNELCQVANGHHTISSWVGSRLWTVCCGKAGLPRVWSKVCWIWLEQSSPHHGIGCTGRGNDSVVLCVSPTALISTCIECFTDIYSLLAHMSHHFILQYLSDCWSEVYWASVPSRQPG